MIRGMQSEISVNILKITDIMRASVVSGNSGSYVIKRYDCGSLYKYYRLCIDKRRFVYRDMKTCIDKAKGSLSYLSLFCGIKRA